MNCSLKAYLFFEIGEVLFYFLFPSKPIKGIDSSYLILEGSLSLELVSIIVAYSCLTTFCCCLAENLKMRLLLDINSSNNNSIILIY